MGKKVKPTVNLKLTWAEAFELVAALERWNEIKHMRESVNTLIDKAKVAFSEINAKVKALEEEHLKKIEYQ